MKKQILLTFILLNLANMTFAATYETSLGSTIKYVNINASPGGDGLSWGTAFVNLQDALAIAFDGMEIWVAQGVYYPDVGVGQVDNEVFSTFSVPNGVKIYGGFNGTETAVNQRDPVTNVTVLSGDIDNNDTVNSDGVTTTFNDIVGANAYHVVTSINAVNNTVLDGITITAGKAFGANFDAWGSAVFCSASSLTMNQLVVQGNLSNGRAAIGDCNPVVTKSSFINNSANEVGAIAESSGTYIDTVFIGNRANFQGSLFYLGADNLNLTRVIIQNNFGTTDAVIRAQSTSLNFNDVLISGNKTRNIAGALNLSGSANGTLTNVTITGNKTTGGGGGIKSSTSGDIVINNSIIWNNQDSSGLGTINANIIHTGSGTITLNSSILQGSGGSSAWTPTTLVDGGGNLDEDPLFILDTDPATAPTTDGDAHLTAFSMAIDTGDNSIVTSTTDLDGNNRFVNATVDMGAYEYLGEQVFMDGFE